ncbi:hypothetical protein C8R44DRAFT_769859 [Mycena epipterygia]|nr:hypothetical protein C8R44DRAFT_769859 [Mycena epipterygia]
MRKTAALCVAKLYDLKPELVLENGFLDRLHDMIADSNPILVCFVANMHTRSWPTPSRH